MASQTRLDPLTFAGSFAYLDSEVPPGMTLPDWRSQRTGLPSVDSSIAAGARRPGPRAPGSHPAGAEEGASAAQRAWPQPKEEPMTFLYSSELLGAQAAARLERRETLRRLGREGRLAAYRRGEFDLDTCCLWASTYRDEVPLLNGEFEFIAAKMQEVCE